MTGPFSIPSTWPFRIGDGPRETHPPPVTGRSASAIEAAATIHTAMNRRTEARGEVSYAFRGSRFVARSTVMIFQPRAALRG